jgi:hypothetical protein
MKKNILLILVPVLITFFTGCSATGSLPTEKYSGHDATKAEKQAEDCAGDKCKTGCDMNTSDSSNKSACGCTHDWHSLTKKEADDAGVKCGCHKH